MVKTGLAESVVECILMRVTFIKKKWIGPY